MARGAEIYVRTSSETQGANSGPIEQETDCRRLAEEKGLQVVRVYRDIEKYRVGNRLVEPSGSRPDDLHYKKRSQMHPGMNSMSSSLGAKTGYIVDCDPC